MAMFSCLDDSFIWSASKMTNEYKSENIPRMYLWEYEQTYSSTLASINHFLYNIQLGIENMGIAIDESNSASEAIYNYARTFSAQTEDVMNPNLYKNLYIAKPTGNIYILPYFTGFNQKIAQTWSQSSVDLPVVNHIIKAVEKMAQAGFAGVSKIGIRHWTQPQEDSYSIKFCLFNTVSEDAYSKNISFLKTIISKNLHLRHNHLLSTPPSLYEVKIPGIRQSPVAVISNLTVENMGQMNFMYGANIPDIFDVTITIQELICQDRAMYRSFVNNSSPINASSSTSAELFTGVIKP